MTRLDKSQNTAKIRPIFKDQDLGWYIDNEIGGIIGGTYIHGIFENDIWRHTYINLIRKKKNLPELPNIKESYKLKREAIINKLANEYKKHLKISSLLN